MKSPTPLLLLLSLPLITYAQTEDFGIQGPNKPGPGVTLENLRISSDAGRNPNASTLTTFDLNHVTTREDYQWRVNISSFAFPNIGTQLGNASANYSENHFIANTQYMLDWPGEEDVFQEYLRGRNMSMKFRVKIVDLPSRISGKWVDDGRGECKGVLGDECVKSIQLAAQAEASNDEMYSFEKMKGCNDTLNAEVREGTTEGGGMFSYGTVPPSNGSALRPLPSNASAAHHRGDVLWYHTSKLYREGNGTDELVSVRRALHVMVVSYTYRTRQLGLATGANVFCAIPAKAVDEESGAGRVVGSMGWVVAILVGVVGLLW